ncbi:MAG: hypothetical protein KDK25_06745 [Leptospiraceae bacterium]|nr:hypothetical protein [Leptospiraceae bacterium]
MQLRSQYGSDVFVIDTREVSESGFLGTGLFKKKIYEVDYMIKEQNAPYHNRKSSESRKGRSQKKTAEQAALSFLAGGSASTGEDSWPSQKRSRSAEYPARPRRALPDTGESPSVSSASIPARTTAATPSSENVAVTKDSSDEVSVPELDQLIASLKALKEETGRDLNREEGQKEVRQSDERMERLLKKMDEMARADAKTARMEDSHPRQASAPRSLAPLQSNDAPGIRVAEPPSAEEIDALWSEEYIPEKASHSDSVQDMPLEAEMSDEALLAAAEASAGPAMTSEASRTSARKLEIHTGHSWGAAATRIGNGRAEADVSAADVGAERLQTPTSIPSVASQDPTARKFLQIRERLLKSNLSSDLADRIIRSVDDSLSRNDLNQPGKIEEVTLEKLTSMIRMVPDIAPPRGQCRAVMLVGPTGSGKSSSIAKLAARYQLKEKREVSIYNLDLYRLGATEMLKTYAQIINAPFHTPFTPEEFRKLLDEDPAEIMLIDTPGIGGRSDRLEQLKQFKDACPVKLDVHLTVAAGTDTRLIDRVFETFDSFGFDKILLTKLDETDFFGAVIEHADKFNRPFSFLMDDPEVRGNIMDARPADLARMLLD